MSASSGVGAAAPALPSKSKSELETRLARYRTALVAMMEMVKREGGWRSSADQQLIRQVENILLDPPLDGNDE